MRRPGGIGPSVVPARRWSLALAVVCAWLLAFASLASAEIIYAHGRAPGAELIAMNDDGSGAHVLLTPSQIPGSPSMINLADPNVAPAGATLAFAAETFANHEINGPVSDCGANCEGIYTLAGGAITRLSSPPTPTVSGSTADDEPMVTADGRVVYETISIVYSKNCVPECEATNSSSGLNVRPIGGGEAQPWTLVSNLVTLPQAAADPANGGLVAYVDGGSIDLASQAGAVTASIAAAHASDPAFSPDGSQLAYVDREAKSEGGNAGVYVVGASSGATPKEVLADPTPPEFPHSGDLHQVTWLGSSGLIVTAGPEEDDNLYSVPAHCLSSPCTLGETTQLTSDASATAPDDSPTWTSATIAGLASTMSTTNTGPASPSTTSTSGTSSFAHAKTKGSVASLTIACAGAAGSSCADSLALSVIETLRSGRLVGVAAKAKKRTVTLGTASVTLTGDQSKTVTVSLNATGRRLLAHRRSLSVKLTVKQEIGGKSVVVKTLTVTFLPPKHSHH
jgi:hypothetical protein